MKKIAGHPESLVPVQTKYCAGCGHGVISRILCELIDEMGLRTKSIVTNPVAAQSGQTSISISILFSRLTGERRQPRPV